MKCSKCKLSDREEGKAYCRSCYAEYMKAYRAKKAEAMSKAVAPNPVEVAMQAPVVSKPTDHVQIAEESSKPSTSEASPFVVPLYASYYMTPGTPLHKQLKEAEASYLLG